MMIIVTIINDDYNDHWDGEESTITIPITTTCNNGDSAKPPTRKRCEIFPTSGSARTALMCWQIFNRVGSNSWRWGLYVADVMVVVMMNLMSMVMIAMMDHH